MQTAAPIASYVPRSGHRQRAIAMVIIVSIRKTVDAERALAFVGDAIESARWRDDRDEEVA